MASAARSCAVAHFAPDEVAPPETLQVMPLQRLRLRRAAKGCLEPIAEEDSAADDAQVPAGSPSARSSSSSTRAAVLGPILRQVRGDVVEVEVLLDVLIPSGRHRHCPGTAAAAGLGLPVAAALSLTGWGERISGGE
ncbi:hypothetical protein TRIUR3_13481 [Triticum urartu]|uniref:Uncharacterized protein n=1 Tax=Triticum urartu TaxID=4572 RepID=M8A0N1_TRIUA|nr:hypothetical protein TRIUR3_13481 [Triticum urartu]